MGNKTGIYVSAIELRIRLADSKDAWDYRTFPHPLSQNLSISGNWEKGKSYEIQARCFSACGTPSDWGDSFLVTPIFGTDAPVGITAITSQPLPLAVQFKLVLGGNGKLPAGASIEVHTAPDVSGSPGSFTDTGLKPQGRQFIIGAPTNVPIWYMFRVVDNRGNEGGFSSQVKVTSTQITDVVGGTGGNLMDPLYAIIGSSRLPVFADHTNWSVGRASIDKVYGYKYLQLTSTSGGTDHELALVASTSDSTKRGWMQLSNQVYGVQVRMENVDSDANGLSFKFRFDNVAGNALPGVLATRVNGGSGNGVWHADLDLTAATDTLVYLRMIWQGSVTSGHRVNCQGWGVFLKEGTSSVVQDFTPPAPATAGDIQDDPDNSGRAITALGLTADRPAAGNAGTLYLATDGGTNGTHYRDDGANWVKVGVGHLGDADGTLDHIAEGATYKRTLATAFAAGTNQIDLSRSAIDGGTGVEGVIRADTAYFNDGQGLGTTADLLFTQNLPPDVATAQAMGMLADAQVSIGVASAVRQVLFSDGGFPYFGDLFGGVVDGGVLGGSDFMSADLLLTGSMANAGNQITVANSFSAPITVLAFLNANFFTSSGGTGDGGDAQIQISLDGGSTWNTSAQICGTRIFVGSQTHAGGVCFHCVTGTPTGPVVIRAQAKQSAGADALKMQQSRSALGYLILNSSNGTGSSNLSASIPATASASATSTYPSTSGTYHKNITITIGGGVAGYTPSTAKTAGTGTVSGSTSTTFTVSDTETTTFAGATHTTTVQSTVMDSQSYTMSTGATESGSTVTGTLTAAGLIPVGATIRVQNAVAAGYNGTALPVVAGTTGTTLKYTAGTTGLGASTHTATIDQVTVATGSCVVTGTFTLKYSSVTVAINGSKSGACNAVGGSCTVTLNLTNDPSGGDKTYSRTNTKTAGTYTLSGSTTTSFSCAQSHAVAGSPSVSGTVQCQATDGHSNTGTNTAGLSFQFNDIT